MAASHAFTFGLVLGLAFAAPDPALAQSVVTSDA
ncbi:MAG: hypothetical protein RJB02_1115, partial [Pseudomonadota bacterium]